MSNPAVVPYILAVRLVKWIKRVHIEESVIGISSCKSFNMRPTCLRSESISLCRCGAGVTARSLSAHTHTPIFWVTVNTSALVEINSYLRTRSRAAETEEDSNHHGRGMGGKGTERMEKIFRSRLFGVLQTAIWSTFSFHSWLEYLTVEPRFSGNKAARFTQDIYRTPKKINYCFISNKTRLQMRHRHVSFSEREVLKVICGWTKRPTWF